MKRIVPVIFILTAAVLSMFFINRKYFLQRTALPGRPRVVKPVVETGSDSSETASDMITDDTAKTTFIPLRSDETLINSLTIDFNGDGSDDQIIVVKRLGSPYLLIILGLYNTAAGAYERTAEIATKIIHEQTFSYTGLDMTGDHRITLVYQGFTADGNSVLGMYLGSSKNGKFYLKSIGSFESDGTIYIDQKSRSDSYELSQSKGVSFPVWVYSSDTSEGASELDQIQTEYDWNEAKQAYTEIQQIKETGKKLAAKELARIQDGTVETFAGFLNGLWYKTTNEGKGIRYLYFDWKSKEIIFLYDDTEEVYAWLDSKLRRNGIYLYTSNTSISNLQRRFDISLVGVDEVRIKLQDDVSMLIKENNMWDGDYKKMSPQGNFAEDEQVPVLKSLLEELTKTSDWSTADGISMSFHSEKYTVQSNSLNETGIYVGYQIKDTPLIQFHVETGSSYISGSYLISNTDDKDDPKQDNLTLTPVIVNPDGYTLSDKHQIVLHRGKAIERR